MENYGRVLQVIGPVVDVEFEAGNLPEIYNAVTIKSEATDDRPALDIVLEAHQHLGNNVVRCVAMSSTDGVQRGMPALDTGETISVPVGEQVLGRIMNVLGEPIDEKGPIVTEQRYQIHRPAPDFTELEPSRVMLETGIQGRGRSGALLPKW